MTKVMTRRRLDVPQEYFDLIGRVTFYWATVEHELVDIIGEAMGIGKKERRILMAKMDPKAKIAMLKVIGSKFVKKPDLRAKINKLSGYANEYYDWRSRFVHGAWTHPIDCPDQVHLQVIDSGEAAFLPQRFDLTQEYRKHLADEFSRLAIYARTVQSLIASERKTKLDNGERSVTSTSETTAPFIVPNHIPDGGHE